MEDLGQELREILSGKIIPDHIVRSLDVEWENGSKPPRADAKFYYIGLRDSLPLERELCGVLRSTIMDFCLPRSEVVAARTKLREADDDTDIIHLLDKATNLFIKARQETKRSGEGGELILFMLLEALGAPQIVSKMYLKQASQVPVFGSDGLHVAYNSGTEQLTLYIGESKLHDKVESSLNSAMKSVRALADDHEKYNRELELVTDHLDANGLSDNFLEALRAYLNPYSSKSIQRRDAHACLIGFSFGAYRDVSTLSNEDAEESLRETLRELAKAKLQQLNERLTAEEYKNINFLFLFLPFTSVEKFRQYFNDQVLRI